MSRARRWRRRFEGRRARFERQVRLTAARLTEGDADLEEDLVQEGLIALLEAEGERGDADERWESVSEDQGIDREDDRESPLRRGRGPATPHQRRPLRRTSPTTVASPPASAGAQK